MSVVDPAALVDDRPADGVFRVHKDAFRSQEIFDLEMQRIFEGSWVFVGMASEVPNPNDFLTSHVGRHPVVIMRDQQGQLGCFINSCRHRGATICHLLKGNKRKHVCQYHGWTYDSAGKLWYLRDKKEGDYPEAFEREDHDLARVPRFEEYRGFLFASMNPGVASLEDHLGDARILIDLICDQSPSGEVELVPGRSVYVFEGNWKMQLENCTDGYHFLAAHKSYFDILARRKAIENTGITDTIFGDNKPAWESEEIVGDFSLPNGIATVWSPNPASPAHPLWDTRDELLERLGPVRTKWVFNGRNTTFFPNMQLAIGFGAQLRVMRPLGPNRTEMNTYCLAPVGESAETRGQRIHQYEDFFNPTGVATPDDNAVYEQCQDGNESTQEPWLQGYMRGLGGTPQEGVSVIERELGIRPAAFREAGFKLQNETIFHAVWREWVRLMTREADAPSAVAPRPVARQEAAA